MYVSKRHFINGDAHIGPHFEKTCRYLIILVANIHVAIHTYPFLYSLIKYSEI